MFDITTEGSPQSARGKLGRLAQHLVPDLDQRAYARARRKDRLKRQRLADSSFLDSSTRRLADLGPRPTHVVVVPSEGQATGNWMPGIRNFYYEAHQVLGEVSDPNTVSAFFVEPGELPSKWQARLADYLHDSGATHLLTHIEYDPESNGALWHWDTFWERTSRRWDGVLLGSMFDSSYRFTEAKAKILARMSRAFVLVDICMPMNGVLRKGRQEVGPVNMPMSRESMALLDARISGVSPGADIAFFGVLYDYRLSLIRQLEAQGLQVAVNPHRADEAADGVATRANQPTWLDYMAGIASSKITLNFAQSNAGPFEQLKTRVMEVGLAGSLLLTDDRDRTRLFWEPSTFRTFGAVADIPRIVNRTLNTEAQRQEDAAVFAARARYLAQHHYWGAIEYGLIQRNLPRLGVEPFSLA